MPKPRVSDEQAKRYMANLENGDYDPDEYSDTLLDLQACREELKEALGELGNMVGNEEFLESQAGVIWKKYGWHDAETTGD
jgi:hypothetical protein